MIVALARKLLIALCRLVTTGETPAGNRMCGAIKRIVAIICDQRMPQESGVSLLKRVRGHGPLNGLKRDHGVRINQF